MQTSPDSKQHRETPWTRADRSAVTAEAIPPRRCRFFHKHIQIQMGHTCIGQHLTHTHRPHHTQQLHAHGPTTHYTVITSAPACATDSYRQLVVWQQGVACTSAVQGTIACTWPQIQPLLSTHYSTGCGKHQRVYDTRLCVAAGSKLAAAKRLSGISEITISPLIVIGGYNVFRPPSSLRQATRRPPSSIAAATARPNDYRQSGTAKNIFSPRPPNVRGQRGTVRQHVLREGNN